MPPTITPSRSPTARTIAPAGARRALPSGRSLRRGSTCATASGRAPRSIIFRRPTAVRCSCSSTAATGSATRRSVSPSPRSARTRTASTSPCPATRWRPTRGSPISWRRCARRSAFSPLARTNWASIQQGFLSAAGRPAAISPRPCPVIPPWRAAFRSAAFSIWNRSRSACSMTSSSSAPTKWRSSVR